MPVTPPDPTDPSQVTQTPDLTAYTQQAQQAKASIDQLNGSAEKFNNILDTMVIGLGGSTKAFDTFVQHSRGIQTFNDQIAGIGKYAQVAGDVLRKLTFETTGNNKAFSAGIDTISGFVQKMTDAADNALKLEHGYLQVAGATGMMGTVFQQAGPNLIGINKILQDYGDVLNNVAKSTNSSLSNVASMYAEMAKTIPDSVNQQVQVTEEAGQTTNNLEAAMKLAAGTSGDFNQVLKGLKIAWEDYNLTGAQALEFTARMSDLSEKFGINLEYTQGFLEKQADAFKMISNGATDVDQSFNRMFQSFRDTGLSAKQSTDLIGGLTTQMSHLSTAQKAFLSAQTGGPGGLRGAFQIDQLLREGKVDEVLKKMEDNLKKHFGGQIVTQADAAQSDQAASQYVKQRAMLQSSAFGGLVKQGPEGDAQAARILEAMKNGTSATAALQTPQKVLSDDIKRGEAIQKQSYTVLGDQLRELQKLTTLAEINSLDKVQKYLGNTDRTDRGIAGDILQDQANLLNQNQKAASNKANEVGGMIRRGDHINAEDDRKESLKNITDQIGVHLPKSFKDSFSQVERNLLSSKPQDNKGTEAYNQSMNKLIDEQKLISQSRPDNRLMNREITTAVNVSKASTSAEAVDRATNVNNRNNNQPANLLTRNDNNVRNVPTPQAGKMDLTIKVSGIVCDSCGKVVHQNPHVQQITGGTSTHGH